jgi:hypothetical protein
VLVVSLVRTSLSVLVVHVVVSVVTLSSVELQHDHLDDLEDFGLVQDLGVEAIVSHLFLMVLEVSLVSCLFLLDLSYFLKFVGVYEEGLSLESLLSNLELGGSSAFWGLVADESIESFSFLGEDFDALDFTEPFKVLSEFSLSGVGREVLHVEIASLLGVLESDLLSLLFSFSLFLLQGFSDINTLSIVFFFMFLLDCIESSFGSVLSVSRIIEANEGEG